MTDCDMTPDDWAHEEGYTDAESMRLDKASSASPALLPCPFCGGEIAPPCDAGYPLDREGKMFMSSCHHCGASILGNTAEEAVRVWNTRAR